MSTYHKTMDKRMFDFEEYYEGVARALPDNSSIAEVGLADGASAVFLAETLVRLGKKFTFHLIDSLDYGGKDQLLTILNHITKAGVRDFCVVLPVDSLNASCHYPDGLFDFVFIDASHKYEFTKADIRLWWRKVKDGGLIAGHDMNSNEGVGVFTAVNEVLPGVSVIQTANGCGVWETIKHHNAKIY